jgi:hypothetical protein
MVCCVIGFDKVNKRNIGGEVMFFPHGEESLEDKVTVCIQVPVFHRIEILHRVCPGDGTLYRSSPS